MNNTQTLSISQLRQKATQAISTAVDRQTPVIVLQRSRPRAILVDLAYFQALEEAVLDLTDAKEAERAKKEKREPLSSYLKRRWGKASL
jgi:prevent-host-death family protein